MIVLPSRDSRLLSWPTAAALLIAFWIGMLTSLVNTSQTFDEGVHLTAGYTFWRHNDYRLNPENGNLPQRVMALPLLLGNYQFVSAESDLWRTSSKWAITWEWFYELGNNTKAMTLMGRAAIGLLAVALGALVWAWSRELFGPLAGMFSLLLYVLSPSILANGALMTSDTASALFFFAATWAWWRLLQRFTVARILMSSLAVAGLFLSKMSAPLIVVVILLLTLIRLLRSEPLPTGGIGLRQIRGRGSQVIAFLCAGVCHVVIILTAIWAFHGFRYAASSPAMPDGIWEEPWESVFNKPAPITLFEQVELGPKQREEVKNIFTRERADQSSWSVGALRAVGKVKQNVLVDEQISRLDRLLGEPPPKLFPRLLEYLRRHQLLPEAYIYGFAHVWRGERERASFFNGDFSLTGWRTFFPYTFLVKTPISLFVIIAIAIAGAVTMRRRAKSRSTETDDCAAGLYDTAPLWILFGVYWTAAIFSHLNIGHRHILPTYPPLFVLCGSAVLWLSAWPGVRGKGKGKQSYPPLARTAGITLCVALVLLVTEVAYRFPHYIAYFNGLVSPVHAYRHLVDSSLDWGQDLPGVRRYIETRHPPTPRYLAYYGYASSDYYHVPTIRAYSTTPHSQPLQILSWEESKSEASVREFLQHAPEYDDDVVGTTIRDGKTVAVVVKRADALRLTAGTYFISATLLQPVTEPRRGAFGPWNERLERKYQSMREMVAPLLSDNQEERSAALGRFPAQYWVEAINYHEYLRFRRLTSFLRQREPDDNVGYSILVYHVTADELSHALDGPPVEMGRDILSELLPAAITPP